MAKKQSLTKELESYLDLPESETKVRITTYIDSDVYMALKAKAKKSGEKYQALLNGYLRKSVLNELDLESRLKRIEKKVFGKGA